MNSSDNRLALRYAKAYYYAEGTAASEKVKTLQDVYKILLPIKEQLNHPLVSTDKKQDILSTALTNYEDSLILHFMSLLLQVKRFYLLDAVVKNVQSLYEQASSISRATITSAMELDAAQSKLITQQLEKMLKAKLIVTNETDKSLIGGVKIKINDLEIDGSVKGRLSKLKNELV